MSAVDFFYIKVLYLYYVIAEDLKKNHEEKERFGEAFDAAAGS